MEKFIEKAKFVLGFIKAILKKVASALVRFFNFCQSRKDAMSDFLSKIENSVNFPISHAFWHIINALAVLAIVVGLLIVLYGLTPVFKHSVDEPDAIPEPQLLQEQPVSESDVAACAKNRMPHSQVRKSTASYQPQPAAREPEQPLPKIALEKLQAAVPTTTFYTVSKKYICNTPEMKEKMETEEWTAEMKQANCYEEIHTDAYEGTQIRREMQRYFPYDSANQQLVVDALADHIAKYPNKQKNSMLYRSRRWISEDNDLNSLFDLWKSIDDAIAANTVNAPAVFDEIKNFVFKNANKGKSFVHKAMPVVALADSASRLEIFRTVRQGYRTLDIDYDWWETSTGRFLAMKSVQQPAMLKYALECFYDLVREEKANRDSENSEALAKYKEQVAKAEADYKAALAAAEADASSRRAFKWSALGVGGISIGAGIAVIIILAFIFALFAILRTVVKLNNTVQELKEKIK